MSVTTARRQALAAEGPERRAELSAGSRRAVPPQGVAESPAEATAPAADDLLERERELTALQAALDSARAGAGRLVVLEGPPGVGKSRLLTAARARARASGMRVLSARGAELERAFAFGVALQLFARQMGGGGAARGEPLLRGPAAYAAPLFDGSGAGSGPGPAEPVSGEAHRAALTVGLCWLVTNLVWSSPEAGGLGLPLLLAVDDAQWSDGASLGFLAQLAERVPELPVTLVVALRTGDPGTPARLLDRLCAQAQGTILRPAPLSLGAVERVLRASLGVAPERVFSCACMAATGGNPFLLGALAEELRAGELAPNAQAAARVGALVPEQVLRSVALRLGRLEVDAVRLARAVAILGDRAELAQVAALADLEIEAAERAADRLAGARLLQTGEPLSFTHPLVAAATREDMGALTRARMHRRAATLLSCAGAGEQHVAAQLLGTRPEGDAAAVGVLRAAARMTLGRGEATGAVALLRRALAEPPSPEEQTGVLVELAQAEAAAGEPEATARLDQALASVEDPGQRARTMLALCRLLCAQGAVGRATELADRALGGLEPGDPLREELLAVYFAAAAFHPPARARAIQRMEPMLHRARAGQLPDDRAVRAQLALRDAATGGKPASVRTLVDSSLDRDPLIESGSHGRALGFAAAALLHVDELGHAECALDQALQTARERGLLVTIAVARHWRAVVHYRRGRLQEAIVDAEAALHIARSGWATYEGWSAAILAHARIETGELDGAREAVRLGEGAPEELLDRALVLEARGRLALLDADPHSALGDFEAAGRHLAERYSEMWHPGIFSWRRAAALAAHHLGRHEQAAEHLRGAEREARRASVARPIGEVQRVAGIIAGGQPGVALLKRAVATLERSPARLEHARTLIELGGAMRRSGERAGSREPLRRGLELAESFGARPLAETALAELRAGGARPRRSALSGPGALTPTEHDIARLVADGLANPQIAQQLYVTTKTVEWHLGHVYRKLDIGSRERLADALAGPPGGPEHAARSADVVEGPDLAR